MDILQQLPDLPDELEELVSGNDKRRRQFRLDVRAYNSALAFTSVGVDVNARAGGVFTYRIRGELRHRIGSLTPQPRELRRFVQFYVIDTAITFLLSTHFAALVKS